MEMLTGCRGPALSWTQGRESTDRGHKVRDDEDGHLVYTEGDILQARCTWTFFRNVLY